jgi:hypothetical protein
MPPQEMPPQGAQPQAQPPQGEPGGGAQAVAEGIHTNLMKFMEMVQDVDPQAAEKLGAVAQAFEQVVAELTSGGGEPQGAPPQAGPPGQSPQGPRAVPM